MASRGGSVPAAARTRLVTQFGCYRSSACNRCLFANIQENGCIYYYQTFRIDLQCFQDRGVKFPTAAPCSGVRGEVGCARRHVTVWRVLRAAYEADDYNNEEDEMTAACDGDSPATDAKSGRLLDCSVDPCPSGTYCRRIAGDIAGRRSTARCCPIGIYC